MNKLKASAFIQALRGHVGDGYVYGAAGLICTVALLMQKFHQYGADMASNYYQKNGDYEKGLCARWLGRWVADCSGLIKAVRRDLTGVWRDVSAQGTYDQCPVSMRGAIKDMPLTPGCTVYMYSTSKRRMGHVGTYIGGGLVIESRGVSFGVMVTKLKERPWQYFGLLDWLDYDLPQEGTYSKPATKPAGNDGGDATNPKPDDLPLLYYKPIHMKGSSVILLQKTLAAYGYRLPKSTLENGEMDGDFGRETRDVVLAYQKVHGLVVDGKVGICTWTSLLE